jgi:feruloyl esterase
VAILSACATAPDKPNPPATTLRLSCPALANQSIPAASIGLPTGGAIIESATEIWEASNGEGRYCRVRGKIAPAAGAGAPDIRFQLNLPARWNGKALQMGGAGYNGTVVEATGSVSFAPGVPPLARGYATYGSDSGHVGNSSTAQFATNEGAIASFGFEHLKKTHDVALALIARHYGKAAEKSYFAGASTGGREAMTAIQRFPQDYDGVIANAPAINFAGVRLHGLAIGRAAYGSTVDGKAAGFIDHGKQELIVKTVMELCDRDDGAADGIVSNVPACKARSGAILKALRCKSGADEGASCLTDAQLGTVKAIAEDFVLPYPLAYGVDRHQGYNILQGADFSHSLGLGKSPAPLAPPTIAANGYLYTQGDGYLRYFAARQPALDTLHLGLNSAASLRPRLVELSATVGAMNPDLSAFRARGGKLIVLHGLADEVISPNVTIAYYQALVAKDGQAAVDSYIRFYTVPGFGHGGGAFVPSWDALGALDGWVMKGTAPGTLKGVDINAATRGRSRPLCVYPGYPKYKGSGNMNDAQSFSCASP